MIILLKGRFVSKLTGPSVPGLVAVVVVGDVGDRPSEEVEWKDGLLQPPAQVVPPTILRWEGRPPTGTVR